MKQTLLPLTIVLSLFALLTAMGNNRLKDPYAVEYVVKATADTVVLDTVPPIQDRQGDFLNNKNRNPFDLKDPDAIEKSVEYDPVTGQYVLTEKIGEDYFRPPTYMTFEEYMEFRRNEEERSYFRQLAGIGVEGEGQAGLDPLAKIDVDRSLLDRLFGGNTVDIRPQGQIDLTFGVDFSRVENPILTERQRRQGGFDFDMNIQMSVSGKIGEKLNLTTNYNTNATFDFDNQIKLDYNSDLFEDDAILKKIEAGNVSLPLRGNLIQGAQSLFGVKTELQFGHLRLTAIASQQKSQQENIKIEGGSQLTEFEVKADEYDENRHFFLTHYNRDNFEGSLDNLPQVRSLFRVENLEVWITNDRNEVDNVRDIVAFADLAEANQAKLVSPDRVTVPGTPVNPDITGRGLPDNTSNDLYNRLLVNDGVREIDQAVSVLQSPEFGLQQASDFEKVSARKLSPQEYTFHPELGFVSLNVNVQPDQVVGVAFTYSYNGQTYKVGELSYNQENTSADSTLNVLFVKMLKSTTQRTDVSTWDLMMKNVYSIGAFNVNRQDFKLDIFYEDPGKGEKRFLPEGEGIMGKPLLRVFNLDILNVQGDPQPDGVFDYVPGVTINPRNGRVMFPVLEPFGTALADQIVEPELEEQYVYQELYDLTIFQAREFPEKNRYSIRGSFKSDVTSEISLGAFNIPPGSVRVSAGGQILQEGRDFEVDYNTGRVRIINDAILNSGVPINVSFEDNTLFGFQTKTMVGLRADYEIDKDFSVGGTFLQLFERPFTQKVNIGEDPINNKIYGFDMNLNREAPFLTKLVNLIPGINTKAPSSISVTGEAAFLKPGHSRAINQNRKDKGGVVYLDDFEGSVSGFDITQPAANWFIASVPQNDADNNNPLFPESSLVNDVRYGSNRARINWYRIDPTIRPSNDPNPYTSEVPQDEVFPNVIQTPDQPRFRTFDISYYPQERGPYNFDVPGGYAGYSQGTRFIGDSMVLDAPETRWGGIMRALTNNDFQSANIEFLEFWMLSPFLDEEDPLNPAADFEEKEGTLFINLGNVSEDILRDSRKFFENGLPGPANPNRRVDTTNWSVVPIAQQITRAFDNDEETRILQDVGYDGLDNDAERRQFRDYLSTITASNPVAADKIAADPANDDYKYYRDDFGQSATVRDRYRLYNNPQGNSRSNDGSGFVSSATNVPDAEDLNRDNTLNETESYFQYQIDLRADPANPREIDQRITQFITDRRVSNDGRRIWYRFRVPLNGPDKRAVGGIRDFRSIRFIRMYMRGFEAPVTLRFARIELVRNQWRRFTQELSDNPVQCDQAPEFDVDAVNIEENSGREPFNYVLPEGIQREQSLGVFNALQNEQSITMRIQSLCDGQDEAIFKNIGMDWRVYERFKMFVHAEELNDQQHEDGELSLFVRVGSDFRNNYYEYEIPLVMSDPDLLPGSPNDIEYKREVWKTENEFDFPLTLLRDAKLERNNQGFSTTEEFLQLVDPDDPALSPRVRVKGNPNLGLVKIAMVGVRNPIGGNSVPRDVEVWINEMRLTGLDERGGMAAVGRVDMQLSDFGNVTVAGNYSSIGFGALDQKVQERARERVTGIDLAANLELGKFFPDAWGIRLPFYAQYSRNVRTPEFDPYDLDIKLKDKVNSAENTQVRDSIRDISQEITTIRSLNFTNVRKERGGGGGRGGGRGGGGQAQPTPWDIENFGLNFAQSTTERSDPIIEFDRETRRTMGLDYGFQRSVKYLEPLKFLGEGKLLEVLTSFNFNPLPNSFTFSTVLDRRLATTRYRFTGLDDRFNTFFNKSYTWGRDYNLQWDIARSLKFTYSAVVDAVVDEPDENRILEDPTIPDAEQYRRDSIWQNIRNFGRTKNFRHNLNLSYTVPTRYLPLMDWVQVKGQYQAEYGWTAAALNVDSLGNVIQNRQTRQANADLNFEGLYNKIPYLQKINGRGSSQRSNLGGRRPQRQEDANQEEEQKRDRSGPSTIEKILIRPLMALRRARFNFSESFSTTLPGFMPQARLLGMQSGFGAPGWDFIAGFQPNIRNLDESQYYTNEDWLHQKAQRGWITSSVFLNQEVVQEYNQKWDGRATIEPFPDFRVDLEITRNFTENHTEFFKDVDQTDGINSWIHTVPKQFGSMTISFSALNTLFQDDREQLIGLFQTFEQNRVIISRRLGNTGELHDDPNLAAQGFTKNYGRNQQDVLIPAFMAAYTGQDANNVGLNIFDTKPRFNWRLTYNGLNKLPLFKEVFQNFSLTHAYRSTLTVNNFNTGLDFLRTVNQAGGPVNELNSNFYPRLEIPQVDIQEGFSPLIQVDATMINGMSFQMNYNKTRRLGMSFISNQLSETQMTELSIGFGYLIRNLDLSNVFGGNARRGNEQNQQPGSNRIGGVRPGNSQGQAQDLDLKFTLSLRDDVTFNHLLDQGIIEPTRGSYALSFSPSAEYRINQQLSLRLFFDYRRNVPKTSAGFPRIDTSGGVIVRFSLQ
jgi:cell surface protein SprA